MHPSETMGGFAPAVQSFATPMVSVNGLLVSRLRDSMPPRPFQVHSSSRPQTALPPPSPAPNFVAEHGNVFSRGGNNFGSNFANTGQQPLNAHNGQQFGQPLFAEPTFTNDPPNYFGASVSGQHPYQHPAGHFMGAPTPQPQLTQPFFGSSRDFGSSTMSFTNPHDARIRFRSSFPTSTTLAANQNDTLMARSPTWFLIRRRH